MRFASVVRRIAAGLAAGAAAGLLGAAGCVGTPDFFANNTAFRSGSLNFVFVNDTPYRASFTFGVYDGLDREPGQVLTSQARVEGNSISSATQLGCRREAAVGTQELIRRAIDADFEDSSDFDSDAFVPVVNFSDAASGTPAAGQPTIGTARGRRVLLGVDFDCNDRLIFTFVEDPLAPGGFRIDFTAIPSDDDDR
jgi:hypothetical protein